MGRLGTPDLEASERFGVASSYALAEPVADFIRENTAANDNATAA